MKIICSILFSLVLFSSCKTTKDLHKTSLKKDSTVSETDLSFALDNVDSSAASVSKTNNVKTDQGTSKITEQEKYDEVTTKEYQETHAKTLPGDYLPVGVVRLNDSTLLTEKVTTKRRGNKLKTETKQANTKDSSITSAGHFVDVKKHAENKDSSSKQATVKTESATTDLHKTTNWWSWWYLLVIPIGYVVYRLNKIYKFIPFI